MEVIIFSNKNNEFFYIPTVDIDVKNIKEIEEQQTKFLNNKLYINAIFSQENEEYIIKNDQMLEGYYVIKNKLLIKKNINRNNWGTTKVNIEILGNFLFLKELSDNAILSLKHNEIDNLMSSTNNILSEFLNDYKKNTDRKYVDRAIKEYISLMNTIKNRRNKCYIANEIYILITNYFQLYKNNSKFTAICIQKLDELMKEDINKYNEIFSPLIYKQVLKQLFK